MGAVLAAETVAPSTTAPVSSFEVSNFTRSLCLESEWNCSAPATVFARDALLLTTDADASLRYDTPFASTRSITVVASFETTDASAQQFVSLLRDEANGGIVVEIGPGSRVRLDGNSAAECKNMSDEGSTYSYDYEGSTYDLYVQNSDEGSTYSYDNEGSTTYDTYLRNSTYSYDYEGSTTYDTYLRNSTYSYDYEGSTTYDSYLRNSSYSYDYESSTNGSYLRKSYEGLSYSYDYEGSTYDLYARIDQDEMVVNLKSSSSDCALYSTKGLATVFEGDDAFLSFGGAHTSWISLAASDEPPTSAPTSINPSRCVVVAVAMDESGSMFGEQAWLPGELSAIFANVEARNFTSFNVLCVSGFGGTESPRDLGCSWFTSSTDYDATFEPFVLDGFLEDGYQGLELAVNISATFIAEHRETFDAACTSVVRAAILVTDEDRDVIDAALTYDAIADLLREDDWILNVIVSIAVSDSTIGVNRHGGTIEATGNGTYAETPAGTVDNRTVSSYAGNTKADYVDLAWDNAGIAWNLEVLREGGASAESFSSAFVDVKVEEITSQTFSPTEAPVLATLSPTPLPTKATTSPKPTPAPTETTYVPTIPRAYPPTPLNLPPTPKPSPLPTPVPTVFVDSTPRPSPQATATGTPTLKPSPLPTPVPTVFVDSTPRPSPQATAPGIDTPHPSTPNPTTGQPTTSQPSTPPTNGLTIPDPTRAPVPDPTLPDPTLPGPPSPQRSPTTQPTALEATAFPTTDAPAATPTVDPSGALPSSSTSTESAAPAASSFRVAITTGIVLDSLDAGAFNADETARSSFRESMADVLEDFETTSEDISNILASPRSSRRRLDESSSSSSNSSDVSFAANVTTTSLDAVVEDVKAVLLTAATDGTFDDLVANLNAASDAITDSTEFNEDLSLRLIDELTGIVGGTSPTPSCAAPDSPSLVSVQFVSTGSSVVATFDQDTDQGGLASGKLFECTVLFDAIPTGLACSWISPSQVEAETGDSEINIGSNWTLRANVIASSCDDDCACSALAERQTVAVAGPDAAIVPVVVFQAPSTVSICADLGVDAYLSSGSTSHDWVRVDWTISSSEASSQQQQQQLLLEDLARNATGSLVLAISTEQLSALYEADARSLTFSLELVNYFDETGVGSIDVQLSPDPRPTVKIVGGTAARDVFRPDLLSVNAYATPASCVASDVVNLEYAWTLTFKGGESTGLESTSNDPREFRLPAHSLQALATYTLEVMVTDLETGNFSTTSVDLECLQSDLVASIDGGNRSISQRGVEEISAELSRDPDVFGESSFELLSYAWTCANLDFAGDQSCERAIVGNTTNASILLVDKEVLGFTSFLFAVRVSRPGRTAQTDSVVIEHTIDPPSVFVTTRTSTPPANNRLVITGVALAYRLLDEQLVTRRRLNTTWSLSSGAFADDQSLADVSRTDLAYSLIENTFDGCEDNDATWYKRGDPSRDCEWVFDYSAARCDARGEDGRFASEGCPVSCSNGCQFTRSDVFLLVNPDSLIEGSSYTFRLEATLTGASDVGVATVDLSVPRSPRGGDVETSPSRGITLETAFTIRATKWEGNEPPLRYRFEVAGGQVLRLSTEDSVAEDVILPVGAACAGGTAAVVDCNVTLVVAITDNIGASTDAGIVAQVNPTFLNSTRLLVVVQNLLEQAKAASAYENVCNVAIAAALSSPDDSQLLELLVSSIAEARELSQGTAEQTELFAACLEAVVTDSSALARETAGTALTEILGVTRAASSILFSSDAAQNSLTVVSQLLDSSLFTSTSSEEDDFVYTAASASANVSLTIDSFTNALIAPLVPDEFATTTYTPNLRVSTRKNSGRDAIDLEAAPGSNARATVPAQPQQYGAAVSEVSVNTHRLEEDGGELSSTSVLRFGLTTSSLTVSGRNTTASLRFPTSNATSAPTAMPLRENVTIACPWNFRGVAQAYCEAENRTISRQCNGTKVEETIGCGVASRDACVTWDGQSWAVETCVRNPDASTEASTVCDCTVDFAYVSNFDDDAEEDDALEDDDDEISETTSEDYATKGVFQTYGQLFARNVFGGSINPRRSRIMIIVLCVFYAVISVLMYASDRFDRRDLELKATTTAARPPGGGTPSSPDTPPDGSSAALDDAVFVVVEDDSPQYETGRRLSRSKSERVRVATALAQTRATVAETYLDPERPSWRKRFLAAMAQHHPFASIWTAYNPRKPRYARVMVLGLEMLLIGASYTFEKQFEFPDPNCREKQSRERCLDRTTFTGRNMCKWNENRGECKYNPPPEDSYRRPEHFFVLLVTTLVVFLMLVVLEESFDVVAKTDAFRIYLTRSAAQASSSGGAPPDVQQHPRASAEQRASFYKGRVSRTSFGFRGRPSRGESMVVVHGDRKVRYGAPPPASSSYGRHTLRRLPLVRKPKHIREEARERTPDVAIAVAARYEEIRTDVREASALQNVVGARRVQILYEIERDFVRKWGYSTDVKVLKANVYRVVLEALELARQWDDIIERIHDPDQVRRLVTEFARVASLSPVERKVYERTVREGFFDGDSNDDEDEDEHRENRKNRPVVTACALLLFSGFLFLPSLYLCVYATNVGRGETINWLVSTAFLVAILYALAIPLQIFLVRVVLPSLILDKLHHNPRLNAASYPFATPLPLDALDFLLDLRPELGPIVDDSEDRFVAELKRMKDHKEDIPLHILEEISTDMRWQRVAIVAAGLFLAGGLLALPQVVQDTIFGEIAMLAPLGAFYFLLNITGSKDDWNSAVLALVTLVLSAAFVVALSNLVAWLHNAILSARGARLRNRRVVTSSLESSVDNSAAAAAAAASSERDSSKHLVASSASESASATDPGDDDAAAAVNFDDSASDPGDDLVADHRSGDDA
ncbi:hypothetical protein CTAYLR_001589 [Chrysophaeum taylorii]|uniref:PKD/REJ-like domain-containing protein n=1 Tax=Chrysophaeum taylorii TaxID=2483200 RepID=A0AAD7XLL5_9STRA|nr:hypothetical protein CTAYLR_001589 [Chrysophaeum taylorii]